MFDLKAVRILPYLLKISGAKVTEPGLITNNKTKKEKSAGFFFRSFAEAPERLTNPTLSVRLCVLLKDPSTSCDQILLLTDSSDRRPIKSFDGSFRSQIKLAFDGSFNLMTLRCPSISSLPNFLDH
jgi:hypothetical protein